MQYMYSGNISGNANAKNSATKDAELKTNKAPFMVERSLQMIA